MLRLFWVNPAVKTRRICEARYTGEGEFGTIVEGYLLLKQAHPARRHCVRNLCVSSVRRGWVGGGLPLAGRQTPYVVWVKGALQLLINRYG